MKAPPAVDVYDPKKEKKGKKRKKIIVYIYCFFTPLSIGEKVYYIRK
jgi:hypothetical protein